MIDLSTKIMATNALDQPVRLSSAASLRLSHNAGVAFGLGNGLPSWLIVAVLSGLVALIGFVASRQRVPPLAGGLLLGGAVANLADRLQGGTVVDFIVISRWPSFNIADIAITSACVLLALTAQRSDRPTTGPQSVAE